MIKDPGYILKNSPVLFLTPTPEEKGDAKMARQVSLSVNDTPIEIDEFVQVFIVRTIGGILSVLKNTGEIESLNLSIEGDAVSIELNNKSVPLSPFVAKITRNTVAGMISALKGVSEINKVHINIRG